MRVPPDGLSAEARNHLEHQKGSVNQIFKMALEINAIVLSDMEIPDVYWKGLPKVHDSNKELLYGIQNLCICFMYFFQGVLVSETCVVMDYSRILETLFSLCLMISKHFLMGSRRNFCIVDFHCGLV